MVGLAGQVLDELDSGSWTRSEVYADGHHIATVTPSTVYFVHTDWLGTERVRTNMAGQVCESITSEPFGEDVVTSTPSGVTGCNPTPDMFTGNPRDTESNLDDFGARYFSSQWGRWMSPDWSASPTEVPYSTLANPQSLNLYAYVGNDPITGEDPDGHLTFGFGDGTNDGSKADWGQLKTEAGQFSAGFANALASDNLAGAGSVDQSSAIGKLGADFGHFVAAAQGATETFVGTTIATGGAALSATGVGPWPALRQWLLVWR